MIQLGERLWIGNSSTAWKDYRAARIEAVLNVAQDLRGNVGWPDMEYMQVGLIDGPGNSLSVYYAAVLSISALVKLRRTLVFCHTGGRSLVVSAMYINISLGYDWDGLMVILSERVDVELPTPHEAHRAVFKQMDWAILREVTR